MTSRLYLIGFINLMLVSITLGLGLDYTAENEIDSSQTEELDAESRFFFPIVLGNGGGGGLNLTQLAALAALAAAALLPLLGLAALGLLLWAILSQQKDHHGGTGYGGGYSSYSSNYRSMDVDKTNWESMSILDWISLAKETYNKYDPSSIDCQKKVICELYQNVDAFGPPARTFMQYFSYLKYAEVMSIPSTVKELLDDLVDAAERGGSMQKDCAEVYEYCDFSLKETLAKYGHIIIHKDKNKKEENKI